MQSALRCLVVLALILMGAGSGSRAEKPDPSLETPMKVVVVRSSDEACEPLCPEWIMAEGMINNDTPALFAKVFQELGERRLPIVIHSPGGSIVAAIQIGYVIRSRKFDVAVGRTNYQGCGPFGKPCEPPAADAGRYRGTLTSHKSYCLSACPLILASGATRMAGIDALVGVHKWHFEMPPGKDAKKKKPQAAKRDPGWDGVVRRMITDFLGKMGNSLALADDMEKAPASSIHLLDMKRRKSLDLITRPEGAQALTSKAVCAAFPPASHCITGGASPKGGASYAAALARAGVMADGKPMTIAVVRHAGPDCEPVCPQWIAAEGVITPATPKLFAKVLKSVGKRGVPVVIDSPGGDLDAALEMARMVRKRGLDVMVAGTLYAGCEPRDTSCKRPSAKAPFKGTPVSSGRHCNGVCALVLAGGRWRYAQGDGAVVIHSPDTYLSRTSSKSSADLLKAFFAESTSSNRLIHAMADLPAGAPSPLPQTELMRIGVITSGASPESVLEPGVCSAADPPYYCVKRK